MFSYIGGKSRIGKWIKDYIPEDTEIYTEAFGGAFWVYIKSNVPYFKNLKKVVYNDVNPLNANLFLCIKQNEEFYEYIKDEPTRDLDRFKVYQKEAFGSDFKFNPNKADFEKGKQYLYTVTHVFSGADPARSSMVKKDKSSKLDAFKKRLVNKSLQTHFDKITDVECLDFDTLINKYDSEKTFHYADPPYFGKASYYSNHPFNDDEHVRLKDTLTNIKGKFALSYYDFYDLKDWYPKSKYNWQIRAFSKQSAAKLGEKQKKTEELLIMNY